MFAAQIEEGPEVVVDDALLELWAELDSQCDPVWLATQQAAIEASLVRQLIIDPDDGSAPLPEETAEWDEEWEGIGLPSDGGAAVLAEEVAALRREVARTRALLAGAVTDRDDASAMVEALRGQRDEARAARDAARVEVRVARHEAGMARSEAVRAVGERDLARADLAHAARSTETGTETGTGTGPAGSGLVAGLADGPGPALAAVLEALVGDLALGPGSGPGARLGCLDGLADTDVVEVAVAAQRLAAWASAVQAAAAGHLRDRWAAGVLAGSDEALWSTAAEVGLACGLSRYAAADLLNTARHLPTRMPTVWALFASGHLDLVKANLVTAKTLALTPQVAAVVEAGLLDRIDPARCGDTAPITRPQLVSLLDRLIAEAAPELEEELAREARARRRVAFRALAYGMGQMTLSTAAEEIEAIRAALNDLTHAARARGRVSDPDNPHARCDPDGRHPGATRADVLSDLITGTANATAAGRATDDNTADTADTDDADTSAGPVADTETSAGTARTDTAAADSSDAARCAEAGTDATDADTSDPADPGEALSGSVSQTVLNPTTPRPCADAADAAAAHGAAGSSTGTGASFRPPGSPPRTRHRRRRTEIVVLVPLSVLTGQSEQPATLAGYGPIPAQLARELATSGHWRCAVTDDRIERSSNPGSGRSPTRGTLLGLGRSTYTPAYSPGPGLRRFIEIRDETCAFPGCRHPATRSEPDHRIPWTDPTTRTSDTPDGATCDCNLQSLCVHHHRLKHRGGITVTAVPGGGTTWTTPTGRTYTTRPEPLA